MQIIIHALDYFETKSQTRNLIQWKSTDIITYRVLEQTYLQYISIRYLGSFAFIKFWADLCAIIIISYIL